MKAILGSRKRYHLKSVSIFLIVVALVAAMVSCDGPAPKYDLTMAVAPAAGGTAIAAASAGGYEAGAVVDIEAIANPGYQFVKWTATAGTLGDENAAATTFTMPAQNVTVTANFVGPLDHFKGYWTDEATAPNVKEVVYLEDQFVSITANVTTAMAFCNPVEKVHGNVTTPISNPTLHYTLYDILYEEEPQMRFVEVDNQFGTQHLEVWGPVGLLVPTQKVEPGHHEPPLRLDHFLLYLVEGLPVVPVDVVLNDQFGGEPDATVYEPVLLANPVRKTHGTEVTEIVYPDEHLVFYNIDIEDAPFQTQVQVNNQFGNQTLDLTDPDLLAVPSTKTELELPPLDHFKCYGLGQTQLIDEEVHLTDQFVDVSATVGSAIGFCNPVEKEHLTVTTPILHDENHLTIYSITLPPADPLYWTVEVDNQFGTQEFNIMGPIGLAVPTQKLVPGDHGPPVGLDHFLLYMVDGSSLGVPVDLSDQFGSEERTVYEPVIFGNPVAKTHGDVVTPISNPLMHLVFYNIESWAFETTQVQVFNQFGGETFDVISSNFLAVPSIKLFAEPFEPPPLP